jgi:hypothetical protein
VVRRVLRQLADALQPVPRLGVLFPESRLRTHLRIRSKPLSFVLLKYFAGFLKLPEQDLHMDLTVQRTPLSGVLFNVDFGSFFEGTKCIIQLTTLPKTGIKKESSLSASGRVLPRSLSESLCV